MYSVVLLQMSYLSPLAAPDKFMGVLICDITCQNQAFVNEMRL